MISAYGKPTPLSVPSSMTGAHVRAAVDGGAHFLIIPVSPMPSTRDRGWGALHLFECADEVVNGDGGS